MPGQKGHKGLAGAKGREGISGEPGIPGTKGALGVKGHRGPKGAEGSDGTPGPRGPPGLPGATGPAGAKGEKGLRGASGPKGTRGKPGPPGSPGTPGGRRQTGQEKENVKSRLMPKEEQLMRTKLRKDVSGSKQPTKKPAWTRESEVRSKSRLQEKEPIPKRKSFSDHKVKDHILQPKLAQQTSQRESSRHRAKSALKRKSRQKPAQRKNTTWKKGSTPMQGSVVLKESGWRLLQRKVTQVKRSVPKLAETEEPVQRNIHKQRKKSTYHQRKKTELCMRSVSTVKPLQPPIKRREITPMPKLQSRGVQHQQPPERPTHGTFSSMGPSSNNHSLLKMDQASFSSLWFSLGTKENPATTCAELQLANMNLTDGYYFIDPNQGAPFDALRVLCNFTAGGATCVSPLSSQLTNSSGHFSYLVYPGLGPVQLRFLRLFSRHTSQRLTLSCHGSFQMSIIEDLQLQGNSGQVIDWRYQSFAVLKRCQEEVDHDVAEVEISSPPDTELLPLSGLSLNDSVLYLDQAAKWINAKLENL
ncbi:collagen alpha-2(XI) chain-like [Pleurodeles waltl]|uniref:collagen alpha-2(XI) chain-like n=1 Tax=Pleurodeles waltl TaxID=8319 RepID=UPI003709A14D